MGRDQSRGSGQRMPRRMEPLISADPYLNQQPDEEPVRCSVCGNVFRDQRWYHPNQLDDINIDGVELETVICGGCKKVQDGSFSGVLSLKGDFLIQHHRELTNRIENRVEAIQLRNPLSKIVDIESGNQEEIILRTTTAKLAEDIGRSLKEAYSGHLTVKKSDNVIHAAWERNEL